jgi:hypothetical protein
MNIVPKWGFYNGALERLYLSTSNITKDPFGTNNIQCMYQSFQRARGADQVVVIENKYIYIYHGQKKYYVQGKSTVPTAANQRPNAIQRISIHLGDRKYEALNPGLTCVVISRATTIE